MHGGTLSQADSHTPMWGKRTSALLLLHTMVVDVEYEFGIEKVAENKWRGNKPLLKPNPASRGAFGGNIAGQALLVAIRLAPEGFKPHSLHSLFTKAVTDDAAVDWEADQIHNGKSFCSRTISGYQNGEIKYIANILLTKRNSYAKSKEVYDEWERNHKEGDDEDEPPSLRPFRFFAPYPEWLKKHHPEDLEYLHFGLNDTVCKMPPEFNSLELTPEEDAVNSTQRRQAFYAKWGKDGEVSIKDPAFQFVGLGVLLDLTFLTRVARILRIPHLLHEDHIQYMSLSLDHVIYFHDEDFDITQWMGCAFNCIRIANGRALFEEQIYNLEGKQVASIFQEGLVLFNGFEEGAKL